MEKNINVEHLDIHYIEEGKGANAIVLLHGWGQSHAFWDDFTNVMAKEYRVIVIDLPGFGLSQEPTTTWKVKDFANFLHIFLSKLTIAQPMIIGHSFGGRIAIEYAARFPVKKLVLYSTGGGVREMSLLKTAYKYLVVSPGKYIAPNLIYKMNSKIFKPEGYVNKNIINTKRSRRMLDIYSQKPEYLVNSLKKINTDTLIIVGKNDFITKPITGNQILKHMQKSKLASIANASHFAHRENPDMFYEKVKEFLEE